MAFTLDSIRPGGQVRPPRILLLGVEKIGKSEFASGADSPIFIPVAGEEGIDTLSVPQYPTCQSFGDVRESFLELGRKEHNYNTGVLDSTSALDLVIHRHLCEKHGVDNIEKVGGGYGKGYTEAVQVWRELTDILDALRSHKNMAFILVGHVQIGTFNDPAGPSYEHYEFDVHKKVRNLLVRWADCILFMNTKTAVSEVKEFAKKTGKGKDFTGGRFLYTQKRPAHPGGGRGLFGKLPYEIQLPNTQIPGSPTSWSAFSNAIQIVAQQ